MAVFDVVGVATVPALFAALCFGLQAIVVDLGVRRGTAFGAAVVSIVVGLLLFWLLEYVASRRPAVVPPDLPFLVAGAVLLQL